MKRRSGEVARRRINKSAVSDRFSRFTFYVSRFRQVLWLVMLMSLSACGPAYIEPFPTLTPSATPSPTVPAMATATPTPLPANAAACPQPGLALGNHISASGSYTETETEAAGPPTCRVERTSCAYYRLVGNLDPSIIFKDEEEPPYNEEDFLMHPTMLLPLSRLNQLVRLEWGDEVLLRVTDAYDSLLEHDLGQADQNRRASLHFEGRSIDLTTWPIDPNRYSRLCSLAHCAGFDWVHNEGDHCHASIQAESLCWQCSESASQRVSESASQ